MSECVYCEVHMFYTIERFRARNTIDWSWSGSAVQSIAGDRLTLLPGLKHLNGSGGKTPPFWKQCESWGGEGKDHEREQCAWDKPRHFGNRLGPLFKCMNTITPKYNITHSSVEGRDLYSLSLSHARCGKLNSQITCMSKKCLLTS